MSQRQKKYLISDLEVVHIRKYFNGLRLKLWHQKDYIYIRI